MPQFSTFHSQLSAFPVALPHNPALSLWLSVDPLSDKYPGSSPYVYCANNPVRLVDVDGREVINYYEGAYNYWSKEYSEARSIFKGFHHNKKAVGYEMAKQNYKSARKNLRYVRSDHNTINRAISDVKKYNPELYQRMENLKDDNGNPINIVVTISVAKNEGGWCNIPPNTPTCPQNLMVSLNPSYTANKEIDNGQVLSHEFGHLDYIVPNWTSYQNYLKSLGENIRDHTGHNRDDPSGKNAMDQAEKYWENKHK